MTTWVVVADSSRGRIYVQDKPSDALTDSEDLIHAGSRLHAGDLVSDRQGSDGGAVGQGRHVIDARTGVKEDEVEIFTKEIAKRLESAQFWIEHLKSSSACDTLRKEKSCKTSSTTSDTTQA